MEFGLSESSHLDYKRSYLDPHYAQVDCVELFKTDARVRRAVNGRPLKVQRTQAQQDSRRGKIGAFTQRSRMRLRSQLRNGPDWKYFLVLTYPTALAPSDDRITKRHLQALTRWLRKRGASFVWKQEFTWKGTPHIHLLSDVPIYRAELRAKWASIIGSAGRKNVAYSAPIRDVERALLYIEKRRGHRSTIIPEGYSNMGRFWGATASAKVFPTVVIEGPSEDIAKLVRPMKRALKVKTGRRPKDRGVVGCRLWEGGGVEMIRDVLRLAAMLGLRCLYRDEGRKSLPKGPP